MWPIHLPLSPHHQPRQTMNTFTIREVDGSSQKLELDTGFALSEQRETTEGTSITLTYAGRRIVLRERRKGTIEAEGDHRQAVSKPRTGASRLADAIEWAANELHTVVRNNGIEISDPTHEEIPTSGGRTLAQARRLAYERQVWAHCSANHQTSYRRYLDILMTLHGPDKRVDVPWSQSDVDLHFAARCGRTRNGRELSPEELAAFGIAKVGIQFPAAYGRRNLNSVKLITAKNELKDIKVMFNYLKRQSVEHVRFLLNNPLDDLDFGNAIRGKRADYHPDRYRWLLAAADHADPTGQLRLLIVLAFQTGHRIDAMLSLEVPHLGFTTRQIRSLIRMVEPTHEREVVASESWAKHFPYGVIRWIPENDKEGFDRIMPLSIKLRREIERYLQKRLRLLAGKESRWLFPRSNDPRKKLASAASNKLLRCAEEIARPHIAAEGLDVDEIMPETPGDAFHPARGWWEARHAELLWEGNRNSAYVGGWTCNTGIVQSSVYGELDPRLMQACIDGKSLHEAAKELGIIEEAKRALDPEEPRLEPASGDRAA